MEMEIATNGHQNTLLVLEKCYKTNFLFHSNLVLITDRAKTNGFITKLLCSAFLATQQLVGVNDILTTDNIKHLQ